MLLSGYTTTKPCAECNKPFTVTRSGRIFCSHKCGFRKHSREYYRSHYAANPKPKRCAWCRHVFQPTKCDQRWCSLECCNKGRNRRTKFIRRTIPCKRCATPFLKIRSDHKFCNSKCADAWWGLRTRAGYRSAARTNCAQCSSDMTGLTPNRKRLYCSKSCARKVAQRLIGERRRYMNSFLMKQAERRARKQVA